MCAACFLLHIACPNTFLTYSSVPLGTPPGRHNGRFRTCPIPGHWHSRAPGRKQNEAFRSDPDQSATNNPVRGTNSLIALCHKGRTAMRVKRSGSRARRWGLALLLCISAQPASAERGTVGEQSRATIQISLSVAPRFPNLAKSARPASSVGEAGDVARSSNMARFTVVRVPPDAQPRGAGGSGEAPQLLIVVPD